MITHRTSSVVPGIINLFSLLCFIRTWTTLDQAISDYSLSLITKEQVGGLELPRLAGTWMRVPATPVQGHPAPGNLTQQTARGLSDLVESLPLPFLSISYAFPWSPLMALVKQERPNLDMTQHGCFSDVFTLQKFGRTGMHTNKPLIFPCYTQL